MDDLPFRIKVDYSDFSKRINDACGSYATEEDNDDFFSRSAADLRKMGITGHVWRRGYLPPKSDLVAHTDYHEDEPENLEEEMHDDAEDVHRAHAVLDLIR